MSDFPQIQVTNTTDGTLELFDVFQTPVGNQAVSATTPVTYTSLGTVAAGVTETVDTLHKSNRIVAMQTGALSDPTTPSQVNFPVKVIVVLSISTNKSFTVAKADKDAMEQTFRFIRYVSANPGSVLATQFLAALDDKDSPTSAVDAFFAGSKSFPLCTMSTWTAVTSWQGEFLSAWQGSYFLYDASDQIKTITLVAVVSISVVADEVTAKIVLADDDGKWTGASQSADLALASSVVSESDPGEGGVSVSMQPVWMNAVQTDGSAANTVIAPTLAGTVNGTKVLGNFKQMPVPSEGNAVDAVLAWLKQNINVSVLISAGMLYFMAKQSQESKPSNSDKAVDEGQKSGKEPAEISQDVATSDAAADANMSRSVARMQADNGEKFADLAGQESAARTAQTRVDVKEAISRQSARLEEVLEEAPASPATDAVVDSLDSAGTKLDAGNIDGALSDLSAVSENVNTLVTNNEASFSQDAKEAAKTVEQDVEASSRQAEAEQQAERDLEGNSDRGAADDVGDKDVAGPDAPAIEMPVGE